MSKTKEIRKVVDLKNLKEISCAVIGISNLSKLDKICSDDVRKSRGEFAGYFLENDELIVFRDRLGARNIYYAVDATSAYVSTDPVWIAKAIKATANWSYILSDYLQFQIPFSEETFFAGVNKVMPGEFVRITQQGVKGKILGYYIWKIRFRPTASTLSDKRCR